MLPYFSCTTADFEIQYFFNKVTVGVLVNTGLILYDWQQTWLYQLKTNVNPRPAGPLDFPTPAGGGGV